MTDERKLFIAGFAVLLVIIFWMFTRIERLEVEVANQSISFDAGNQPQSLPTNNAKALAAQAALDLQRAIEPQRRQDAERRYSDSVQATQTAMFERNQQRMRNYEATLQAGWQRERDRWQATQEAIWSN